MKEFDAQTGGRYTYVDDIVNLQELALAFASVFDDCDNFIISGCEVSETAISSGYVYISGKIRYFSGISGITAWPQYIYETNKTETIPYASGDDKVGRKIYGCAISSKVPNIPDELTGDVPAFIELTENGGGMRLNDAFFGKYALLLNSAAGTQTVGDVVTFGKDININGAVIAKNYMSLVKDNAKGKMFYSGNKLVIQSQVSNKTMNIVVGNNDFQFSINNEVLCTINANGIVAPYSITAPVITIGNIKITQNNIINKGVANDDGCISINMTGYNDGTMYYRNLVIGDGKGHEVIKVIGQTKNVQINGNLAINSDTTASLSLKKNKLIQWLNDTDTPIAHVGYDNTSVFEIKNTIGSITISAIGSVNITPAIKENGVLLSEKYVTRTDLASELLKKANITDVYTQTTCDTKFLIKNQGLAPLRGLFSLDELCAQIGAATKAYSDDTFISKTKLLQDLKVSSDNDRQTICEHIGAAYAPNYQTKLKDTGWKKINISANGAYYTDNQLYARQIGNIVYIQGKAKICKDEDWYFILPTDISKPTHAVSFTYRRNDTSYWSAWIEAKSSNIKTASHSNINGEEIPITITYMV